MPFIKSLSFCTAHILDNNKKSLAIFLVIGKVFDSVNHDILLNILPSFGINKCSLNEFKSCLINRKRTVKINEVNVWN